MDGDSRRLGGEAPVWAAASLPQRITLEGRWVSVAPLDPTSHGEALYQMTQGPGAAELWLYLFDGPYPDRDGFDRSLEGMAAHRKTRCSSRLSTRAPAARSGVPRI